MWLVGKRAVGTLAGILMVLPGWLALHGGVGARPPAVPTVDGANAVAAAPAAPSALDIDRSFPLPSGSRSAVSVLASGAGSVGAGPAGAGVVANSALPDIALAGADQAGSGPVRNLGRLLLRQRDSLASQEGVARMAAVMQSGAKSDDIVASIGANAAQAAIDAGLHRVEEELCCAGIVRSLNLSWSPGYADRATLVQADATFRSYDGENLAVMTQLGLQSRDKEAAGNIGVAMRAMVTPDMLMGINVFYDYLSEPRLDRWSVGADVRGRWVSFSGNYYTAISDPKRTGNEEVYTPDGWDLELAGQVPGMPWFGYGARYYSWYRRGDDNLTGAEYTLSLNPMSMITLKAKYDQPESGDGDLGFEAQLRYDFHQTLERQLSYQGILPAEDAWQQRFARVNRQYEQRVQRRQLGPRTTTLLRQVACDANAPVPGEACVMLVAVPQGASSVTITGQPASNGANASSGGSDLLRVVPDFCTVASITSASGCRLQNPAAGDMVRITGFATTTPVRLSFAYYNSGSVVVSTQQISVTPERIRVGVTAAQSSITEGTGSTTITITATPAPTSAQGLTVRFTVTGGDIGTSYNLADAGNNAVSLTNGSGSVTIPTGQTSVALTLSAPQDSNTVSEAILFTLSPASDGSYGVSESEASALVNISDDDASSDTTLSSLVLSITLDNAFSANRRSYTAMVPNSVTSVQVTTATAADSNAISVAVLDGSNNNVGLNANIALTEGSVTTITVRVTAEDSSTGDYTIAVTRPAPPQQGRPTVSFAQPTLTVPENGGSQNVQITILPATHSGFTLMLSAGGTAAVNTDYSVTSGLSGPHPNYTIVVAPTVTSATFAIATVDNDVDDATDKTVVFTITATANPAYSIGANGVVTLTIQDDDMRGVVVSPEPPARVDVREGGTATYTVRLDSEPTGQVTVTPNIPLAATNKISVSSATFTATTWNVAQTVTVTALEDDADQNDEEVTITHTAAGGGYAGLPNNRIGSVTVRVDDNDDAVSTDATLSGVAVLADGMPPSVTATISPSRPTVYEAEVPSGTNSVTVTATPNSPAFQSVVINGDMPDNMNRVVVALQSGLTSISIAVTAEDGTTMQAYTLEVTREAAMVMLPTVSFAQSTLSPPESVGSQDVQITISPGTHSGFTLRLRVSGSAMGDDFSQNVLTETAPGSGMYTMDVMASAPSVTIPLTITDDDIDDDNETVVFTITANTAAYSIGTNPAVTLTIQDDDARGVEVPETVRVREGGTATYMVRLLSEPTAQVTVTPSSSDTTAVTVAPPDPVTNSFPLTFTTTAGQAVSGTTSGWNVAQTVTVTALQEQVMDANNNSFMITHSVLGGDYDALSVRAVMVTVDDDDDAVSTDATLSALTLALTDSMMTDVPLSPAFSSSQMTGYTASVPNGTSSVTVTATPTSPAAESVVINSTPADDSDTAVVSGLQAGANQISIVVTAEDSATTASYMVTVTVLPDVSFAAAATDVTESAGDVTVTVSTTDTTHSGIQVSLTIGGNATLGTDPLALGTDFTQTGLSTADSGMTYTLSIAANQPDQSFTISIVDDPDIEDPENIIFTIADDDDSYTVVSARRVYTVNITDNDVRGLVLSTTALDNIGEAINPGSYTIALATRPTATVMVTPVSDDTEAATVEPASGSFPLMFTATTWNVAQTVNVAGVADDDTMDEVVTVTHTVAGGDYGSLPDEEIGSVLVEVDDADDAVSTDATLSALSMSPTGTPALVFEAGTTSYTTTVPFSSSSVIVTAQTSAPSPPATVVVSLRSEDADPHPMGGFLVENLRVGTANANEVKVRVTAEDRVTTIEYTVTVTREEANANSNLQSLSISPPPPTPLVFDAMTTSYTVSVPNATEDITVTAVAAETTASIAMEDALDSSALMVVVTPGTMPDDVSRTSPSIMLQPNVPRTVRVTVTAESGAQTAYTITVTRMAAAALPMVSFAAASDTASEAASDRQVTLNVSPGTHPMLTVSMELDSTIDNAATIGTDFTQAGLTDAGSGTYTIVIAENAGSISFTLDAAEDNIHEGNEIAVFTLQSDNSSYRLGTTPEFRFNITDNDTRGVTLSSTALTVPVDDPVDPNDDPGGSYTVTLNSEPTDNVMVTPSIRSEDTSMVTVAAASGTLPLVFDASNWFMPQTVNVTGVAATTNPVTITHTVSGGDYDMLMDGDVPNVTVTVSDTAAEMDATLSALAVTLDDDMMTAVPLSRAFSSSIMTGYTAIVENAVEEVQITATPTQTAARVSSISLGGQQAVNGLVSNLVVGNNVVSIVVTAIDRATVETYSVTVVRSDPLPVVSVQTAAANTLGEGDAATIRLEVRPPTNIDVNFSIGSTDAGSEQDYSLTLTQDDTDITGNTMVSIPAAGFLELDVTALQDDDSTNEAITFTIEGDGRVEEDEGVYDISETDASLTFNVNDDEDASLQSLSISPGTLNETFAAATTAYTATVSVDSVTVTAAPVTGATAVVSFGGAPAPAPDGGMPNEFSVSGLVIGANQVFIDVTATMDGSTKRYTLTLTRERSSDATLQFLSISEGTLDPPFVAADTTRSYIAMVPNATRSITVTAAAASAQASVAVTLGDATATATAVPDEENRYTYDVQSLQVGPNAISVAVTAEDGSTETYTITVRRADPAAVPNIDSVRSSAAAIPEEASATLTITSDLPAPDGGISVNFTISGVEAADYALADSVGDPVVITVMPDMTMTGMISIPSGERSVELTLTAQADPDTDARETLTFTIAAGDGYSGTPSVRVDIFPAPEISVSPTSGSVTEGDSEDDSIDITIGATPAPLAAIAVTFSITGGTVPADATDFSLTSGGMPVSIDNMGNGTLTLPAGATMVRATLTAVVDNDPMDEELAFSVTTDDDDGYTLATASSATITIRRLLPEVSIAASRPIVQVGATDGTEASTITISSPVAPAANVDIDFTISGGTVPADPDDYTLETTGGDDVSGTLTLPAGMTMVQATLTAADDSDTDTESLVITLDTPADGADYRLDTGGVSSVSISILPMAATPLLSVVTDDDTVDEGESATITISLVPPPAADLTVNYSISVPDRIDTADLTLTGTGLTRVDPDPANMISGTVTIPTAGPTPGTRMLTLGTDDDTVTMMETLTFALVDDTEDPDEYDLADGAGSVEITIEPVVEVSSNADLADLRLLGGLTLAPVFAANMLAYRAMEGSMGEVAATVDTANMTIRVADNNATLAVTTTTAEEPVKPGMDGSYAVDLVTGATVVSIRVTAEDTTTVKTYTLTITRAASTDATLSALSTSVGTLDPAFAAGMNAYAVMVGSGVGDLTVTPTVSHSAATLSVTTTTAGATVDVGEKMERSYVVSVGLVAGDNVFNIRVTAEDGTTTNTYTITVNRPQPEVNISSSPDAITEVQTATITISIAPTVTTSTMVNYSIAGVDDDDYNLALALGQTGAAVTASTVTIPADTGMVTLILTPVDDSDQAEMLTMTIMPISGATYTIGTATATVTINPAQLASVSASAGDIAEGQSVTITVTLAPPPRADTAVAYTIMGVDATDFEGAVSLDSTVTVGTLGTGTLTLTAMNDTDTMPETFTFTISSSDTDSYNLDPDLNRRSVEVTINLLPEISIATTTTNLSVEEESRVTITITADPAPATTIAVGYTVSGMDIDDDITPEDYTFISGVSGGMVSFPSGSTSRDVVLMANDDGDEEETLVFALQEGTGYGLPPLPTNPGDPNLRQSTVTITPLARTASVTAPADPILEGGTRVLTISVSPTPASGNSVVVNFTISGDNITIGDYMVPDATRMPVMDDMTGTATVDATGTLSFSLETVSDADTEPETLTFTLNDGTGYTAHATNDSVMVTINPIPVLSVMAAADSVLEGSKVELTLSLAPMPTEDVTVNFSISGISITGGAMGDFTLGNPPNNEPGITVNGLTGTVIIDTTGERVLDLTAERDDNSVETLIFTIRPPADGTSYELPPPPANTGDPDPRSVEIRIDPIPEISVSSVPSSAEVTEGGSITLNLRSSPAPMQELTVGYSLSFPDRIAFADLTLTTGTGLTRVDTEPTNPGGHRMISGTVTMPTGGARMLTLETADDTVTMMESLTFALVDDTEEPDVYDVDGGTASIRIYPRSTVSVRASMARIYERQGSTLTITATPPPRAPLPVRVNITGVDFPDDFTAGGPVNLDPPVPPATDIMGTVTVPTSGTAMVTITALDDNDLTSETLVFALQEGTGYALSPPPANPGDPAPSVEIGIDPLSTVSVSISPDSVTEGDDATITLMAVSPAPVRPLPVNYSIVPGSIDIADLTLDGTMLTSTTGTVTIPTTGTVALALETDDDTVTMMETLTFTVRSDPLYKLGANRASRLDINPRVVIPEASIAGTASIEEGQSATLTISFNDDMDMPVSTSVNVTVNITISGSANVQRGHFSVTGGTGVSFPTTAPTFPTNPLMGTVTVAANTMTRNFTINALRNGYTMNETLTVTVAATGSGYTVGSPASAVVTIEPTPVVSVMANPTALVAGDSDNDSSTLILSVVPAGAVTVNFRVAGVAISDFSLMIGANQISLTTLSSTVHQGMVAVPEEGMATLTLQAPRDTDTMLETLVFTIRDPGGTEYRVGAANAASITIDPLRVSLGRGARGTITPEAAGGAAATTLTLNVDNSNSLRQDLPVTFTINPGVGRADSSDFRLAIGNVTLTPVGNIYTATVPMSAGSVELTMTALADDDSIAESAVFRLTRPGSSQYALAASTSATITINPIPRLSVMAVRGAITEGDVGTVIAIRSNIDVGSALTVPYTVSGPGIEAGGEGEEGDFTITGVGGTADPADPTSLTGTISVPASATAGAVAMLMLVARTDDDGQEMLTFTIEDGTGYTVGTATATVTINPAPAISVRTDAPTPVTVTEGDRDGITLTVSSDVTLGEALVVNYEISAVMGTIESGESGDYDLVLVPGQNGAAVTATTVTIPANQSMVRLTLTALVDDDTGNETLRFAITAKDSGSGNYTIGSPGAVDVRIMQAPRISVTASDDSVPEGGDVTLTIESDMALVNPQPVSYRISAVMGMGTIDATDFRPGSSLTGTVTIPAGSGTPSATLTLTTLADSDTVPETMLFAIDTGAGYAIGSPGSQEITIEPIPEVSVTTTGSTTVPVGSSIMLTVTAAAPAPSATLTVNYTISGDSITNADFSLTGDNVPDRAADGLSGTISVPTTGSITLTLQALDDGSGSDSGQPLTFAIAASDDSSGDYTIGNTIGSPGSVGITIQPLVTPEISVSANPDNPSVFEGGAGITLTVSSDVTLGEALVVNYRISAVPGMGTIEPGDFSLGPPESVDPDDDDELRGTVTIPANQSMVRLTLTAVVDPDTGNETLRFAIAASDSNSGDYTISSVEGEDSVNVIIQPAPDPELSVMTSSPTVFVGSMVTLTVSADPAPVSPLTVGYTIAGVGGDNITGADFDLDEEDTASQHTNELSGTITIPTTGSLAITLTATDDGDDTDPETLVFTIDSGSGYTLGTGSVNVIIQPMAVAAPTAVSVEASTNAIYARTTNNSVTLTVRADPAPTSPLTVSYTISGDGISGADFALTGTARQDADELGGDISIPTSGLRVAFLTASIDSESVNQTLMFSIDSGDSYTVPMLTGSVNVTILPPTVANPPEISLSADSRMVTEGDSVTLTVTATPPPSGPLVVNYEVSPSGGAEITAADFTLSGSKVARNPGRPLLGSFVVPTSGGSSSTATLTLTAVDDDDRSDERMIFEIANGTGYTVSRRMPDAVITIQPMFLPEIWTRTSGSVTSVREGAAVTVEVRADNADSSFFPLTVNYRITGGVVGADFSLTGPTGTVNAAGDGLSGTLTMRSAVSTFTLSALAEEVDPDSGQNETLVFSIIPRPGGDYVLATGEGITTSFNLTIIDVPPVVLPEFDLSPSSKTVNMGFSVGVDIVQVNTANVDCSGTIPYTITTSPPGLASNVSIRTDRGSGPALNGAFPCRQELADYQLTTLTMQQQYSATITITLSPSQSGVYALRPDEGSMPPVTSMTVTVQNHEYRPRANMSVGHVAFGLNSFVSILEGATTTINYDVTLPASYPNQPPGRTFRNNVPLMFRIGGNAPRTGAYTLTEHGTNRAISVEADGTFSVTVMAGDTSINGINVIAADDLDDTYRLVIDLIDDDRSEPRYYVGAYGRGVVELAMGSEGGLPTLVTSVNNTSISPSHADPTMRTATISISSNIRVMSPLTLRYALSTERTVNGRYYSLSYNGTVFDGWNGSSVVSNNSLQLAANSNNWEITLTPFSSSYFTTENAGLQNLVFWLQPSADYIASAGALPNAPTAAVSVDMSLYDPSAPRVLPDTSGGSPSGARLRISYGGDLVAGGDVGVVIDNANGNVAADLPVTVGVSISGVNASDITFTGLSGGGNRTATIRRGTSEVEIRVAAASGITEAGFVELTIMPGNGYYSIFGGRSGIYVIPPGTSLPKLSVTSNVDRIEDRVEGRTPRIVGGDPGSTATITVSSTESLPANTQMYYQVRSDGILGAYNLTFNGAPATSPVTISGAGPWRFTLSAPRTGSSTLENFTFFVDYGLEYDPADPNSDRTSIDIVQSR